MERDVRAIISHLKYGDIPLSGSTWLKPNARRYETFVSDHRKVIVELNPDNPNLLNIFSWPMIGFGEPDTEIVLDPKNCLDVEATFGKSALSVEEIRILLNSLVQALVSKPISIY